MDFDFHGRPDFARRFVTRTARALADPGMLQLMGLNKCYRALARGKVESLRKFTPDVPDTERLECRARAVRYPRIALQYAILGSEPMVLIVIGRVGSGKSTLARALGRELDWETFSSDRIRKELGGLPLHVRGAKPERRRLCSKAMSDKTYAALARHAATQIRQQRSVILDATFGSRPRREQLRKVLARAGVDCCFVETRAATATIKNRLKEREHSAGEISDAQLDDLATLTRTYE